tara:strand:+ start:3054 stop:3272 length:219 start_codon:yes stop_codon:yes gene_type:complete
MSDSFRDCVWYKNALRAGNKALLLSNKTADSMIVVKDLETNMFGVTKGNGTPKWCTKQKGFDFICTIHPVTH